MSTRKNTTKHKLHPRSRHRDQYDFEELSKVYPELSKFIFINKYGNESIDFSNPTAVKFLNKALLFYHYNLSYWEIPEGYLCPPIPGRADYIHYIADYLAEENSGKVPLGSNIRCLDIGMGANCIYPIIGRKEYEWSFLGSDIDRIAIQNANQIIDSNLLLKDKVMTKLQSSHDHIFSGIIQPDEYFDLTICNPPFHSSEEEAQKGTLRKLNNLQSKDSKKSILNFGGKNNELWTKGGELTFIKNMIHESKKFKTTCFCFSTLISKKENLKKINVELKKVEAKKIKIIPMRQGNKQSRIVVWSFLNEKQKNFWIKRRF